MSGYQVQNESDFSIINVSCQQCIPKTTTSIFYATIEVVSIGGGQYECKIHPMNYTSEMGYFLVSPPGATMSFQFIGGDIVQRVIGVVSSPYLSDLSYPDNSTLNFTLSGLPATFQASLSVMVEWV